MSVPNLVVATTMDLAVSRPAPTRVVVMLKLQEATELIDEDRGTNGSVAIA